MEQFPQSEVFSFSSLHQMKGIFPNGSNRHVRILSQGTFFLGFIYKLRYILTLLIPERNTLASLDRCSPPRLKHEPSRALLTSHNERVCCTTVDMVGKGSPAFDEVKRNAKLLAKKFSTYFLSKSLDKNDTESQHEDASVNPDVDEVNGGQYKDASVNKDMDEVYSDHPVPTASSNRRGYQDFAGKKRKLPYASTFENVIFNFPFLYPVLSYSI